MLIWTCTIPGEPCAKGRPRFSRRSGRAYTPAKTAAWATMAGWYMRDGGLPDAPLSGPLYVEIVATFARPKSRMKKADWHGPAPHVVKPDADNIAKLVLDALQAAGVIEDDKTVCRLYVSKLWADYDWPTKTSAEPWVQVSIAPVETPGAIYIDRGQA